MHELRIDERMQLSYEHTQTSWVGAVLVLVVGVTVLAITAASGGMTPLLLALTVAILIAALVLATLFGRLTVTVRDGAVAAAFGFGRPRRTIRLDHVVEVAQVRNSWWYGWGIRWIPGGSMYNVWGLDAVELRLAGGRVFRIGTDDPAELCTALDVALGQEPGR